jgi:soluble lytic murein transglycosylase-like protein
MRKVVLAFVLCGSWCLAGAADSVALGPSEGDEAPVSGSRSQQRLSAPQPTAKPASAFLDTIVASQDERGRTVYVNGPKAAPEQEEAGTPRRSSALVYWSNREQRWKPVPPPTAAAFKAARSAAAEVMSSVRPGQAGNAPSAPASVRAADRSSVFNRSYNTAVLAELHRLQQAPASKGPIAASGAPANSTEVDRAIVQAAARHHVDANLVRAIVKVESNFNTRAVSPKGAMGLMQLMPETARHLNVADPFDPGENVEAGVRHLRALLDNYRGDLKLSLAAYNAGESAVARSHGIPNIAETRNYVKQITTSYAGGAAAGTSALPSFSGSTPIRVYRREDGVLTITNE